MVRRREKRKGNLRCEQKKGVGIKKRKIALDRWSIAERWRKVLRGVARQTRREGVCFSMCATVNLSVLPAGVCVQIIQSASH